MITNPPSSTSSSTFWTVVAFTINYIIGSGFLTIPWAFEKVGIVLGTIILCLFAGFSIVSTFLVLETIERAQICEKHNVELTDKQIIRQHSHDEADILADEAKAHDEFDNLLFTYYTKTEVTRKREIVELCENFLGRRMANFYLGVILIFIYGILWAYSSVFANSFHHYYPLGTYSYVIYLLIFASITIPMSLLELSEQLYIQMILSLFRFVMFTLLILSVFFASFYQRDDFGLENKGNDEVNIVTPHFSKMQYLIPIAAFSFLFHHAIPSLTESIHHSKTGFNSIFSTAIIVCTLSYILLGVTLAWYFHDNISSACNLNWKNYEIKGFYNFSLLVRTVVLLFPAIDVASAFPLNALSLGNALVSAYFRDRISDLPNNRLRVCLFRLIAAVPPIIGSAFIGDLGHITDYTGIPGLLIMFVFPPLLSWQSSKKLTNLGLIPRSIHSNFLTGPFFQLFLFCTGIFLVFYVTLTL